MALKLLASLSYRVKSRRFSLSPAEQPLNYVALFVLEPVKQSRQAGSRLAVHVAQKNDGCIP